MFGAFKETEKKYSMACVQMLQDIPNLAIEDLRCKIVTKVLQHLSTLTKIYMNNFRAGLSYMWGAQERLAFLSCIFTTS